MHNVEKIYQKNINAALDNFFKEIETFFVKKGFSFKRTSSTGFSVNNVPLILTVDNSSIQFDTRLMSKEMFEIFEKEKEDFESDSFETLEEFLKFFKKFPVFLSKKLITTRNIGILEVKKFNDFYAN